MTRIKESDYLNALPYIPLFAFSNSYLQYQENPDSRGSYHVGQASSSENVIPAKLSSS